MKSQIGKFFPMRSHPAQYGETFDGPPTLERSGSEHRVGRLHPSFLRREGLVRMWSSLWKGRRRDSKKAFFNGKKRCQ